MHFRGRRQRPRCPLGATCRPSRFLYSFAREYSSINYVRLDPRGASGTDTLARVKSYLAAGFPSAFGFAVFISMSQEADIPFPTVFDSVRRGQASIAIGYDNNYKIRSALKAPCSFATPGAAPGATTATVGRLTTRGCFGHHSCQESRLCGLSCAGHCTNP